MYAWLWRRLPGGTALKTLQAVLLVLVAVVVLFAVVFPWAESSIPFLQVTVETPTPGASSGPASPSP